MVIWVELERCADGQRLIHSEGQTGGGELKRSIEGKTFVIFFGMLQGHEFKLTIGRNLELEIDHRGGSASTG